MNPIKWTYIYWDLKNEERGLLEYATVGEALGAAFEHLDNAKQPRRPIEIWHKGWIMYNRDALWAKYQKYQADKGVDK